MCVSVLPPPAALPIAPLGRGDLAKVMAGVWSQQDCGWGAAGVLPRCHRPCGWSPGCTHAGWEMAPAPRMSSTKGNGVIAGVRTGRGDGGGGQGDMDRDGYWGDGGDPL